jgi:glycosyltransferase involved in cell wall biosynthesis
MQGRPKLSVTVLNYNYGRYLARALDSILVQTMTDFEIILIDDCSTDHSAEIARRYTADSRVRFIHHEQNRGYVYSLLEGTEASRGEYATVISADDLVASPRAFEQQAGVLDRRQAAAFCFGAFQRVRAETGEVAATHRSFDDDRVLSGSDFLRGYITDKQIQVLHSGCMVRMSAYREVGGYRRDFRYAVDFALWQMLATVGEVAYVADPLYAYGIHAGQMSVSGASVDRSTAEVLASIEASCARAAEHGLGSPDLLRKALDYCLYAVAVDDAFDGRAKLAIRRCMTAIRQRPIAALRARRLRVIAIRLVLGDHLYWRLRNAAVAPQP